MSPSRRQLVLFASLVATASLLALSAFAQIDVESGVLNYRGFTIDVSLVIGDPDFADVEDSVKHQIDVVADCGAKPEIIDFFRGRRITLRHMTGDELGRYVPGRGVLMDATPQPPEKPILLHELLHAFHALWMPEGFRNAYILRFYYNAKHGRRYPAKAYVLSNAKEFFAVTASIYLWGDADRPPYTRDRLREAQPEYYRWLGQLFGVWK